MEHDVPGFAFIAGLLPEGTSRIPHEITMGINIPGKGKFPPPALSGGILA
jgi:hypothetical protein